MPQAPLDSSDADFDELKSRTLASALGRMKREDRVDSVMRGPRFVPASWGQQHGGARTASANAVSLDAYFDALAPSPSSRPNSAIEDSPARSGSGAGASSGSRSRSGPPGSPPRSLSPGARAARHSVEAAERRLRERRERRDRRDAAAQRQREQADVLLYGSKAASPTPRSHPWRRPTTAATSPESAEVAAVERDGIREFREFRQMVGGIEDEDEPDPPSGAHSLGMYSSEGEPGRITTAAATDSTALQYSERTGIRRAMPQRLANGFGRGAGERETDHKAPSRASPQPGRLGENARGTSASPRFLAKVENLSPPSSPGGYAKQATGEEDYAVAHAPTDGKGRREHNLAERTEHRLNHKDAWDKVSRSPSSRPSSILRNSGSATTPNGKQGMMSRVSAAGRYNASQRAVTIAPDTKFPPHDTAASFRGENASAATDDINRELASVGSSSESSSSSAEVAECVSDITPPNNSARALRRRQLLLESNLRKEQLLGTRSSNGASPRHQVEDYMPSKAKGYDTRGNNTMGIGDENGGAEFSALLSVEKKASAVAGSKAKSGGTLTISSILEDDSIFSFTSESSSSSATPASFALEKQRKPGARVRDRVPHIQRTLTTATGDTIERTNRFSSPSVNSFSREHSTASHEKHAAVPSLDDFFEGSHAADSDWPIDISLGDAQSHLLPPMHSEHDVVVDLDKLNTAAAEFVEVSYCSRFITVHRYTHYL